MIEKEVWSLIKNRYKKSNFFARLFIRLRWFYTPFNSISFHLPKEGKILDLGCGYGLFSVTLALLSAKREVIGIDHDKMRISVADTASKDLQNITFSVGSTSVLDSGNYSGIALIDFFHYFGPEEQRLLLSKIHNILQADGVFVFRQIDSDRGFVFFINVWVEKLMIALGITRGGKLFFRTKNEWVAEAQNTGFNVESIEQHKFPFCDVLFVCKKKNGN